MARKLGILSLGKESSRSLAELADAVRERQASREWLALLEREHGYLMALTRLASEQRREARENAAQ